MNADGSNRGLLTTLDKESGELWHWVISYFESNRWIRGGFAQGENDYGLFALNLETGERVPTPQPFHFAGAWFFDEEGLALADNGDELYAARTQGFPAQIVESTTVKVLEGYVLDGDLIPQIGFSENGTVVYTPQASMRRTSRMYWVTRDGDRWEISLPENLYLAPRVSPDGDFIAMGTMDRKGAIQITLLDIRRGVLEVLTDNKGWGSGPACWKMDSQGFVYTQFNERNRASLIDYDLDTGIQTPLRSEPKMGVQPVLSKDGRFFAYVRAKSNMESDIMLSVDGGDPEPLVEGVGRCTSPCFDPVGPYLAYVTNESGRWEVYVKPCGRPGRRIQVSLEGGTDPVWAPDGSELFYRTGDSVFAVPIEREGRLRVGQAEKLFEFPFGSESSQIASSFDMHPDGDRFVMVDKVAGHTMATEVVVIKNFLEEVKGVLGISGKG